MTGAAPVVPGDIIAGKYRVDRVLGAGGMGVVVAATHEQLDQRVAIKFLLPEVVSREEVVARFLREARAAVKIHSEHVSRVIDVGTLETGAPYMVMELLEGEDLGQVLEARGPLPVAEAVGYVLEACEAVAEAHALGIVHRDLKPPNLFLARRPSGPPTVKVLDFGISKAPLSAKEKALTQEAALMGSPAYMSPEQMRASRDVDARSDIWSMGVVLHELVTNALPFPGESVAVLVTATLHEPHQLLAASRRDLPGGLQKVVDRCLDKDASRRFASIADLARALVPFGPPRCELSLERIITVLGTRGTPSLGPTLASAPVIGGLPTLTAPTLAVSTSSGNPGTVTLSPTSSGPHRRTRSLVLPGVLLGMLAMGAVAFAAMRMARTGAEPASPAADRSTAAMAIVAVAPSAAPAPAPSVTVIPSTAATVAPTATPSAAETASARTAAGTWRAKQTATATAAPTAAVVAPPGSRPCKVVSFFDADGNKHFKKDCPP